MSMIARVHTTTSLLFWLSHKIGMLDALIAETAVGLDAPLATFNDKHYRVVVGLRLLQPYSRRL